MAAKRAKAARAEPRTEGDELSGLLRDLAVLTAANNLMAQTAFLTVERLRISTEVVDERVSNEFGSQLFERCEKLVQASDALILRALDASGAEDEAADLVRGLLKLRREFSASTRKPTEQRRLLESMERMYR